MGPSVRERRCAREVRDSLSSIAGYTYVQPGHRTSSGDADEQRVVTRVLYDQQCWITHGREYGRYPPRLHDFSYDRTGEALQR